MLKVLLVAILIKTTHFRLCVLCVELCCCRDWVKGEGEGEGKTDTAALGGAQL